jgi:hypothetical protein
MDPLDALARTDIDPAILAQVRALFEQQQVKFARQETVLVEKDFKITALTHELAYYRRIRFGKASEALAGEPRLLFEETVDSDLAAIEEELDGQAYKRHLIPSTRTDAFPVRAPSEIGPQIAVEA